MAGEIRNQGYLGIAAVLLQHLEIKSEEQDDTLLRIGTSITGGTPEKLVMVWHRRNQSFRFLDQNGGKQSNAVKETGTQRVSE